MNYSQEINDTRYIERDGRMYRVTATGEQPICNAVIEKLTPFIGSEVRIKVVLNQDDFSSIPAFGSFIEFEIPENLSKLVIGRGDKTERGSAAPGGAPGNVAPPPGMTAPSGGNSVPPPPPPPPGAKKA